MLSSRKMIEKVAAETANDLWAALDRRTDTTIDNVIDTRTLSESLQI